MEYKIGATRKSSAGDGGVPGPAGTIHAVRAGELPALCGAHRLNRFEARFPADGAWPTGTVCPRCLVAVEQTS